MDPARLTTELERLMELLWTETERLAEMAEEAARAEVTHKAAYARALLLAEGTQAVREATAVAETEDALLARRIAESRLLAQRELLGTIRAEIDALRTLHASARTVT